MSDSMISSAVIEDAATEIQKGLESIASSIDYARDPLVTERRDREVNITDAVCEIGFQLDILATAFVRIADSLERYVTFKCGKGL